MDDRLEELLAEGPGNDEEAYELEEYVQAHLNDCDKLRQEVLEEIESLRSRYHYLGKEMNSYRTKIRSVLPDFGG